MAPKQPPRVVYEFLRVNPSMDKSSVRDYILAEVEAFEAITTEKWIGWKLGCSQARARNAIKWAQVNKRTRWARGDINHGNKDQSTGNQKAGKEKS